MPVSISPVQDIVSDMRNGKMVILVDDEDRENEGDITIAADFVTAESINFMVTHARGLVCLTLTEERCRRLGLTQMVENNNSPYNTAFTVSIEAAEGVTTGISAQDRALTIKTAVAKNAKPSDLVQPGHIFPIAAKPGGVLVRAGHTEASCDLAKMAGLTPAAVICEIMNEDGTMARLPDLMIFAEKHNLKIGAIADLIRYRSQNESVVTRVGGREIQTPYGNFNCALYKDELTNSAHLALIHGTINGGKETLVRVHQPVSIVDLLETNKLSRSWNFAQAADAVKNSESGVILLMNCELSGENIFGKFEVSSNATQTAASSSQDLRSYGIGAQILRDLGVRKMKLLTSHKRIPSMTGFGLDLTGFLDSPN